MKLLMSIIEKGRFLALMCVLLGCLAIQAADDLITQQITIKLDKAGTLPNKISDTKKYKIANLKVIGEINGTDVRLIRDMAGGGFNLDDGTDGRLKMLDLSEARFVKGGDCFGYYIRDDKTFYVYADTDDKVPDLCLANCHLSSIVLPANITSIGESAFGYCDITTLKIPDSVTIIEGSAFAGTRLTELDIPQSVVKIGMAAFQQCISLSSISLPSSITYMGAYIFQGCSSLSSVYVSWKTPFPVDWSTFMDVDKQKCTLYVPKDTFQDYWLADVWGDFENIVEYDVTGIDKVTTSTDAKEISRYSVNGQRLSAPAKGLNIVKYSDGSVKKVAVQ